MVFRGLFLKRCFQRFVEVAISDPALTKMASANGTVDVVGEAGAKVDKSPTTTDRKQYWQEYYDAAPVKPPVNASLFAQWAQEWSDEHNVPAGASLLDIGCGNCRDSTFFAKNAWNVTAVDITARLDTANDNFTFVQAGMDELEDKIDDTKFDVMYSRFSLHAVPQAIADSAVQYSFKALKSGGRVFIEARSVNDDLYGQGDPVPGERDAFSAKTAHAAAHFRRFLRLDEIAKQLEALGFSIEYSKESDDFAPHKSERPVCVRVVGVKP